MPVRVVSSRLKPPQPMNAYVEAHPKGKFGKHSYHLDELGLDGDAISERFSDYIKATT